MNTGIEFSRISKLFVDRDQTSVDEALARRRNHGVTLVCGDDVAGSYVLQLAVMTASCLANRCFPGAVRIALDRGLADSRVLLWPSLGLTFAQALNSLAIASALEGRADC